MQADVRISVQPALPSHEQSHCMDHCLPSLNADLKLKYHISSGQEAYLTCAQHVPDQ